MRTPEDVPTDPDALLRYGRIASVDHGAARCTVQLDDGVETPPLRWIAPRMGETRVWIPPSAGEQVQVICPGGEIGAGLVLGGIGSAANPAPASDAAPLIVFKDGAQIRYDPDAHELSIVLPAGATTSLISGGGIAVTGDVTLTGQLTASVDVIADGISLNSHTHGGVQAGGSQTGAPQ